MVTEIAIALIALVSGAIGAAGQYIIARRKTHIEEETADIQRGEFTFRSAKELIDWYRGDYVKLRERITLLEAENQKKDDEIRLLRTENAQQRSEIEALAREVKRLVAAMEAGGIKAH